MGLSEELAWRGFINQTTFADIKDIDKKSRTLYFGVDPSASSMTIGHLAPAMMVRHFIEHGYKAILLVGGATGMIGDPDGKKDERNLLTLDDIAHNKAAIADQYKTVFAGRDFVTVDNYDWFKDIEFLPFLREIGKHVPMSSMLGRDFVKQRLGDDGSGISYAEFSYSLIQGYDFLHLFREHGATLQVCGADQWGNSIAGVDLIRRLEASEAHVLSTPLIINKATGKKFGKTEEGAVWLDPALTSPYRFYQFWLNADDEGTEEYLKIYTMIPREEIEAIIAEHASRPAARVAQRRLAQEVTDLVHGRERRESIEQVTAVLFGDNKLDTLSPEQIDMLSQELPVSARGVTIVNALVEHGIASSNGEARRLLSGGAISLSGEKVSEDSVVSELALLKKGKNQFILVK